ncbi:MAG: PqqD family peptide modification chaperone [Actinomycetota bacterium]
MIPDEDIRIRTEIDADEIDAGFVPRARSDVKWVEIEGEAVLLVEETTRLHWLNPTGTVVWKCLDGAIALDELSDELSAAFGAEREVIHKDVLDLVREFGKAGLLDGVAMETPKPYTGPEGLEIGTELQPFSLPDLDGVGVSLEDLRGRRLLLVNWSPTCGFCEQIAPDLAELQPELDRRGIDLVLVALGDADGNRELMEETGLSFTVLLNDGTELEAFKGLGTPSAYLIDEGGKVASELALGADKVPALAAQAAGRAAE